MIGWMTVLVAQAATPVAAPIATTSTPVPECAPGVYLESGDPAAPQLQPLENTAIESRKVTNLGGFMFTGGISGLKVKSVLPGLRSTRQAASKRPIFRFCFAVVTAESDGGTGSGYVGTAPAATSPVDYRLVQFETKKDQRELTMAKSTMFRGIKTVLADSTYRFSATEVTPGQFRVTFDYDLPPGEFGFVRASGGPQLKKPKKGQIPGVGEPGQQVYAFGLIAS
ncbi:MAG: hypothetical protein J0M19_13650 [Sphingomonadales bacterium]|nr:hypothetical protein [Sphingomonadales bacterium]